MLVLNINGKPVPIEVEGEMPLLWALRDLLNLTGTKYGCGIAVCGACTVLIDGQPARSCSLPVADIAEGAAITTIEGLAAKDANGGQSHPVQRAWAELDVPQCGYCQSGQILAAVALLQEKPKPSDEDIDAAMTNICRCGTYQSIRAAIHRAAELSAS